MVPSHTEQKLKMVVSWSWGWESHFTLIKIIVDQDGKSSVMRPCGQPALCWLMFFPPNKSPGLLKIIMVSASVIASGSPVNTLINYPQCEQISFKKPPVCLFSQPHSVPSNLSSPVPLINWSLSQISPQHLVWLCIVFSSGEPAVVLMDPTQPRVFRAGEWVSALVGLLDQYLKVLTTLDM